MSGFSSIKGLCSKFCPASEDTPAFSPDMTSFIYELFHSVAPKVVDCVRSVKISQVHTAASECLLEMCKLYKGITSSERKNAELKEELVYIIEVVKSEQAKTTLRKCVTILEELDEAFAPMI